MYINLDIARGLAAFGVFLFHLRPLLEVSSPFIAQLAHYGYLGVPLFFVISGYVITSSAEGIIRNSKTAGHFLKRRFLRIYPPFWASIIVIVIIPYIMEAVSFLKTGKYLWPSPMYQSLTTTEWFQIASLSKVFMSDNGDLSKQFSAVNIVYWTLAIEFQFYLCVYVALIFRKYFRRIILFITIVSLLLILFPQPLNAGLFINFWPMFAIGIVLYYLTAYEITPEKIFPFHNKSISISAILVLTSILCLVILAHFDLLKSSFLVIFPSVDLGFAFFSAIILWLAIPLDQPLVTIKNEGNMISRTLVKAAAFLGVISYSLYLLHGKISAFSEMFVRQVIPIKSAFYPILIIGGTIILSSLFYRYVEKPFMSKRQKKIYLDMVTSGSRESPKHDL